MEENLFTVNVNKKRKRGTNVKAEDVIKVHELQKRFPTANAHEIRSRLEYGLNWHIDTITAIMNGERDYLLGDQQEEKPEEWEGKTEEMLLTFQKMDTGAIIFKILRYATELVDGPKFDDVPGTLARLELLTEALKPRYITDEDEFRRIKKEALKQWAPKE